MSIGARLRDERMRLGLSQTDFAALVGASKRAQLKWEKDESAPTAPAFSAWAEAGVDVLYILTGKRTAGRPPAEEALINEDIDEIERELLDPGRVRRPSETEADAERRVLQKAHTCLKRILEHDAADLPSAIVERASALFDLVQNPMGLSLHRAAEFAQKRQEREDAEELLNIWFKGWPYQPDHAVMKQLVMLSMEYRVPYRVLVDLGNTIHKDVEEQRWADGVIQHHESGTKSKSTDD